MIQNHIFHLTRAAHNNQTQYLHYVIHRAAKFVIVTSFFDEVLAEQPSNCTIGLLCSSLFEKAGFLGIIISMVSVLSIVKISNMDGLSIGFSWTHKRAICKHLINLHDEDVSSSDLSINSIALPLIHSSYA